MTQEDYKAAAAAGNVVREAPPAAPLPAQHVEASGGYSLDDFLPLLVELLSPKQYLSAAPTFVPRNFLEAIQHMDDGAGTVRLYLYVNGTWRYTNLT